MAWNRFREYRKGDLQAVWRDLREEDLREYAVISFTDVDVIETYIMQFSRGLQTWDSDQGPLAVLGVTPDAEPEAGCIWAVAANKASSRWRFAVRETPTQLDRLGAGFKVLTNFKDTRNVQQIRWLRRLGFIFIRTEPDFAGSGIPFHQFVRIVQ